MAKHAKTKTSNGNGSVPVRREYTRPAPYPKKSRVEVRYEGGPSKPVNGKPVAVKISTPQPSTKGKGKGKAVDKPESDLSTTSAANPSATRAQPSSSTFLIIAGSYEKLLYGLEGSYPPGSSNPTLKPIFIFPAHLACVKAIAASPGGKWLATGSEDEFVKVWDLRRRKEVGSLSQHEGEWHAPFSCVASSHVMLIQLLTSPLGSITSLHFPTPSHLVTTSVDSTISLFRTTDWALLKSLKGHSGRVNHVDVHPTGRVALSVGKDGTLRMWDLMRGRGAASLPLGSGQSTTAIHAAFP